MNCNHAGLLWMLGLLFATPAWAQSPGDTISAAVAALRSKGDLTPLVEYIDWNSRYENLSAPERTAKGFSSAEDLKKHYQILAKDNGQRYVEQIKEEAKNAAPGERTKLLSTIGKVEAELARQQQRFRDELAQVAYNVGAVTLEGEDKARINLERVRGKSITAVEVQMHLVNGQWLLQSGEGLNPLPSPFGSPLGALPEPVVVLGQP